MGYQVARSGMTLAVGADHYIDTDNEFETVSSVEDDLGKVVFRVNAREGVPITVSKAVAYHTSRGVPCNELNDRCRRTLDRVQEHGFEHFYVQQEQWLDEFWRNCDVEIEGQPAIQQAVRWCLFQLAQAVIDQIPDRDQTDQRAISDWVQALPLRDLQQEWAWPQTTPKADCPEPEARAAAA